MGRKVEKRRKGGGEKRGEEREAEKKNLRGGEKSNLRKAADEPPLHSLP